MNPSFREDAASQIPALQLLLKLGYTYLSPEEALEARGGKTTAVLLEDVLRRQLKAINSIRKGSGSISYFSDANIEAGIRALKDLPFQEGYIAACQAAYDRITLGKALEQSIDGDKKSFTLQYIDWERPENNVFHVTEEYAVTRTGRTDSYRPDIVLFVNGIPLGIIECKRPDMKEPLSQAISQHIRNQATDGIRSLYVYSQILLAVACFTAKYATTDTKEEFWATWREDETKDERQKTKEDRGDTEEKSQETQDSFSRNAPPGAFCGNTKQLAPLEVLVNTPLPEEQQAALYQTRTAAERAQMEAREAETLQVSVQDQYLYALCRPQRLLKIIKDYILFEGGLYKKIARYQQFFTIEHILQRVGATPHFPKNTTPLFPENTTPLSPLSFGEGPGVRPRAGGVIWHTQGSGKSLTMALLARLLHQRVRNAKIVLVTDRVDLDLQITDTFARVEVPVHRARTGAQLAGLLQSKSDAVITTVINKFEAAVSRLRDTPLSSPDIFVLIDEGHRTQYGAFNVKMQLVLPNACFLAFTGTPLMKKEKSTAHKFGGIIEPAYTIRQAVEDGAIVPILYEGRHALQEVSQSAIDKGFGYVAEGLTDYQQRDLKKKYSRADLVKKTEQRIDEIARDISDHFYNNWGPDATGERSGFKGMVVTPDKATAIKYKKAFDLIGKVETEVILSPPDDREGSEDPHEEPADEVVRYWRQQEAKWGKDFEPRLLNSFRKTDHPELLIVVDKLLTGFDEPRVVVMYLCRRLKEHTLLQAIARVNRVAPGKDFGYLVDYEGVMGALDEALNIYTALEGFEAADLDGTVTDVAKEVARLRERHADLLSLFRTLPNKLDIVSYGALLADVAIRTAFYDKFSLFARTLKMATATVAWERDTPAADKETYSRDLRFFTALRNAVSQQYSDTVDFRKYEKQLQKLLDQHVTTGEILRLTEPVSILDTEAFEAEVDRLTGDRAKAEAIASRTARHATERMGADPVFYKKLSELIAETIAGLRAERLSEAEALKRLRELRQEALNRGAAADVPPQLHELPEALACYRLGQEAAGLSPERALQLALAADEIFRKYRVVDWQTKLDVTRRMNFYVGEYAIDELGLSIEEAEALATQMLEIAKTGYKS